MAVRDFMSILHDRTLERLPDDLRETCQVRARSVWFQVHFHSPRVHYEIWLARKIERIEIGLHFEGPHDFSYRWAELISGHMEEIQAAVGPEYELEEWTSSWARLHETVPYDPPSVALADELAARLSRLIAVCQPVIERERENVPPELEITVPAKRATTRSRFRRKASRSP
jgi:hypothetical protein